MGYGNLNADIYSQTELNCKKYSVCHPERSEGAGCISMCFEILCDAPLKWQAKDSFQKKSQNNSVCYNHLKLSLSNHEERMPLPLRDFFFSFARLSGVCPAEHLAP